jgi:hypothetical protein
MGDPVAEAFVYGAAALGHPREQRFCPRARLVDRTLAPGRVGVKGVRQPLSFLVHSL